MVLVHREAYLSIYYHFQDILAGNIEMFLFDSPLHLNNYFQVSFIFYFFFIKFISFYMYGNNNNNKIKLLSQLLISDSGQILRNNTRKSSTVM